MVQNRFIRAALAGGAALCFFGADFKSGVERGVKDAENLSLVHDRIQATALLVKLHKVSSADDRKVLSLKIEKLAEIFYTDRGHQLYQMGRAMFEQEKFSEGVEKLAESDELEAGNTKVLEMLSVGQLQQQRLPDAEAAVQRGLKLNPFSIELERTRLSVLIAQEKWSEAARQADILMLDYKDKSAQTLKDHGLVLIKNQKKAEAATYLALALSQDTQHPEIYNLLSTLGTPVEEKKHLTKYIELCKQKRHWQYKREVNLCGAVSQAQKKLALLEPQAQ